MMFLLQGRRLNREETLRALQGGFTENDRGMWWEGLIWLILALGLAALALRLLAMWRERGKRPAPRSSDRLFRTLLASLGIPPASRRVRIKTRTGAPPDTRKT